MAAGRGPAPVEPVAALAKGYGQLDRFGFIDPSNGGESHRRSLSIQGSQTVASGKVHYSADGIDYRLQLFSNFIYASNPVDGAQFEQFDDRVALGGAVSWQQPVRLGTFESDWRVGLDARHDDIDPVGLHLTTARRRNLTIREDAVKQTLAGLWTARSTRWTPWLRSETGVRADRFDFDVSSSLAVNSGSGDDGLVSLKVSIALGPWKDTEFLLAAGRGSHSNDARGATISVDPNDGVTPADPVTPLVAARGREIGLRTAFVPRAQLSVALWQLDLDSELRFVGDGGNTEAT